MNDRPVLRTMAEFRHEKQGVKATNRETLEVLAERLSKLATLGQPDQAPDYMEVDTSQYLDPALFEREKRAIFERYPLAAGLTRDMPNPGDFLRIEDAFTPIFVTRTKSGKAKAFVNGCRHRGTEIVAEERGCGKALFTCPYHGWTYSPDGELVGVPNGDAFEGLDRKRFGLIELDCEERQGIIFVAPRADQKLDLDSYLVNEEFEHEMGTWGFDTLEPVKSGPMVLDANWKLVYDTFLETYHFGVAHKDNLALYYNCNANTIDPVGKHLRVGISMKTLNSEYMNMPKESRVPENYVHVSYLLFPGIIVSSSPQVMQMFRIFPKSVNKTVVQFTTYTRLPLEQDGNRGMMEDLFDNATDIVMSEDFPFGATTAQKTIESGAIKKIIFGRNELSLQLMQRNIKQALGEIG